MLGADRLSAPTAAVTTGRDLPQRRGLPRGQLINAALAALFSRGFLGGGQLGSTFNSEQLGHWHRRRRIGKRHQRRYHADRPRNHWNGACPNGLDCQRARPARRGIVGCYMPRAERRGLATSILQSFLCSTSNRKRARPDRAGPSVAASNGHSGAMVGKG
jgi:hypothetical protein